MRGPGGSDRIETGPPPGDNAALAMRLAFEKERRLSLSSARGRAVEWYPTDVLSREAPVTATAMLVREIWHDRRRRTPALTGGTYLLTSMDALRTAALPSTRNVAKSEREPGGNAGLPLYRALAQRLCGEIDGGAFGSDGPLPSERELAHRDHRRLDQPLHRLTPSHSPSLAGSTRPRTT